MIMLSDCSYINIMTGEIYVL